MVTVTVAMVMAAVATVMVTVVTVGGLVMAVVVVQQGCNSTSSHDCVPGFAALFCTALTAAYHDRV